MAQSEVNILILETKKYEHQLEFLIAEREMILKAQLEGKGVDPAVQVKDIHEAEERRVQLDEEINSLNRQWMNTVEKIKDQTERELSENEVKEFRSRLAILREELNDKNKQIEIIAKDKKKIEETSEKALQMGMQIGEQSEEIDELNDKYKRALRDKVDIYDELVESLKELVQRNARFMKNEVEIC
jgi:hypothetical protein